MEFVTVFKDDLERSIYLMKIASEFIMEHAAESVKFYDEAVCDGMCLSEELKVMAEGLEQEDEA